MGLGSTAKKIQKLADIAEDSYKRMNELKEQLADLRTTVEDTGDRVRDLERELDDQRALLEAVAEQQGVDPDSVLTDAVIEDAEGAAGPGDAESPE